MVGTGGRGGARQDALINIGAEPTCLPDPPGGDETGLRARSQNGGKKGTHLGPPNESERAGETRRAHPALSHRSPVPYPRSPSLTLLAWWKW